MLECDITEAVEFDLMRYAADLIFLKLCMISELKKSATRNGPTACRRVRANDTTSALKSMKPMCTYRAESWGSHSSVRLENHCGFE